MNVVCFLVLNNRIWHCSELYSLAANYFAFCLDKFEYFDLFLRVCHFAILVANLFSRFDSALTFSAVVSLVYYFYINNSIIFYVHVSFEFLDLSFYVPN